MTTVSLRPATVTDGAAMWRLIDTMGGLEANSGYAYLLLASHFAATTVVAERAGELVGFVAAYRPPSQPDQIFVWQIGVAPDARGTGLGGRLLDALVALPACHDARHLTATVSPDNTASLALFHGFAARHELSCERRVGFPSALFATPHPDEDLLVIGPLRG
jgi:L-2,4-diaminobutyric acid acetyltransferase